MDTFRDPLPFRFTRKYIKTSKRQREKLTYFKGQSFKISKYCHVIITSN